MYKFIARSLVLVFAATLAVLMATDNSFNRTVEANGLAADPNPLLAEWAGPYGGLPPFDKVQIAMFKPALEAAMTENLSEVENIARVRSAPTFENTIVALEKAGHTLDRVTTIYGIWGSTMASPEFQVVQREMAPKLAKFNDQITQNEPLFKRIEAVYNSPTRRSLRLSSSVWSGCTTPTLCVRARSSMRKAKSGSARSTSNSQGYSPSLVKTFYLKRTTSPSP
jgi:peptidyl-dipeptidase Dcp